MGKNKVQRTFPFDDKKLGSTYFSFRTRIQNQNVCSSFFLLSFLSNKHHRSIFSSGKLVCFDNLAKIHSKYLGYSTTSLCFGWYIPSIYNFDLRTALHRARIRLTQWDISFRHGVQEVSITLPLFTANVEEKLGLTWNSTFNSAESQA